MAKEAESTAGGLGHRIINCEHSLDASRTLTEKLAEFNVTLEGVSNRLDVIHDRLAVLLHEQPANSLVEPLLASMTTRGLQGHVGASFDACPAGDDQRKTLWPPAPPHTGRPAAEWPPRPSRRDACGSDFGLCFKFRIPDLYCSFRIAESIRLREKADDVWIHEQLRARRAAREAANHDRHGGGGRFPCKPRPMTKSEQIQYANRYHGSEMQHADLFLHDFIIEDSVRSDFVCDVVPRSFACIRALAVDFLLSFLRRPTEHYTTFLFVSVDQDEVFLCARMEEETLRAHAEDSGYVMQLCPKGVKERLDIAIPSKGPQTTAFLPYSSLFRKLGLFDDRCFTEADCIRLMSDRISDMIDLDAFLHWDLMRSYFPLHNKRTLERFEKEWASLKFTGTPWRSEYSDDVNEYFGSGVALYFVFSAHLIKYLVYLFLFYATVTLATAILHWPDFSFLGFVIGSAHSESRVALCVSNIVWIRCLIWTLRTQVEKKVDKWGLNDRGANTEVKSPPNPRFHGTLMPSESDLNYYQVDAPTDSKRRGRSMSLAISLFLAVCTVGVMISLLTLGMLLDSKGYPWGYTLASLVTVVMIKVCQGLWRWASTYIVDMELHPDLDSYSHSWAKKLFLTQFISAFANFIYVAFPMQCMNSCPRFFESDRNGCWEYLCHMMLIVFSLYLLCTVLDMLRPLKRIHSQILEEQREAERMGHRIGDMSFIEKQAKFPPYDHDEQAEDYCQQVIPLTFVLLFGAALPICPMLALLSGCVHLRAVAWKITHSFRRPFPSFASELGMWEVLLDHLARLALLLNVGLVCFSLKPIADLRFDEQLVRFCGGCLVIGVALLLAELTIPRFDADTLVSKARQRRQKEVVRTLKAHHQVTLGKPHPPQGRERDSNHLDDTCRSEAWVQDFKCFRPVPHLAEHRVKLRVAKTGLDFHGLQGLNAGHKYFESPPPMRLSLH